MTSLTAATGDVSPGLLGFLVVAGLGIALYLLVKSMNKQISKIEVPREADLDKPDAAENGDPEPNGAH